MTRRILAAAVAAWFAFTVPAWAAQKQIIITSGTTWTAPPDWSASGAKIEGIGGGASGGAAYSKKTSGLSVILPGQPVAIQIGQGTSWNLNGGDTCFNGCTFFKAQGAQGRNGGAAASSVGDVTYSGGQSNAGGSGYTSGGGAAGPNGPGSSNFNTTGGNADNNTVLGTAGGNGASGTEWGSAGSGAGAGQGGTGCCQPGSYGGGGIVATGANGAQGVLVITYTPRVRSYGGAF